MAGQLLETDLAVKFVPELVLSEYRSVVARRDAAETPEPDRDELALKAKQLRGRWKAWQGEDSLAEMAFGEPIE